MKRLYQFVDSLTEYLGMITIIAMTAIVLLQVFCRYCLNSSLSWPEETSRFCFIWCTYAGISMAMESQSHLRVELHDMYAGNNTLRAINLICMLVNAAFFVIAVLLGIDMTEKVYSINQLAVSIDFPIWIVWAGIPFFCFFVLLQALRHAYRLCVEIKTAEKNSP